MRAPCAKLLCALAIIAGASTARAADLSEPRKTLAALFAAMSAGDVPAATSCFVFDDKPQEEIAAVNLAQKWSSRRVVNAAAAKWGDEARKIFGSELKDKYLADMAAQAASAEISVEGDTATVGKKHELNPNGETELTGIQLKKVGADWKIVADTFSDVSSDIRPRDLALMKSLQGATCRICDETAVEIAAGKYASAQAAYDAYTARLQQAVRAAATATTTASRPAH